ncbi:hypothetical protein ACWGKX_42090, partial [Streptomyces tricolor]
MVYTPRSARPGALLVGTVAVLGLLTACGDGSGAHSAGPATVAGTAAPVRETPRTPQSATASSPAATGSSTAGTGSPSVPRASGAAGGGWGRPPPPPAGGRRAPPPQPARRGRPP